MACGGIPYSILQGRPVFPGCLPGAADPADLANLAFPNPPVARSAQTQPDDASIPLDAVGLGQGRQPGAHDISASTNTTAVSRRSSSMALGGSTDTSSATTIRASARSRSSRLIRSASVIADPSSNSNRETRQRLPIDLPVSPSRGGGALHVLNHAEEQQTCPGSADTEECPAQ